MAQENLAINKDSVRQALQQWLPDYMIPAFFVVLSALPLTANGKVNRQALPKVAAQDLAQAGYAAPVGETEEILAAIWQDLLNVERVGRHGNFFYLGGHSLLIICLIAKLQAKYLSLDVQTVFNTPTLHALATALTAPTTATFVQAPENLIPESCAHIHPKLTPMVTLTQAQIDAIA